MMVNSLRIYFSIVVLAMGSLLSGCQLSTSFQSTSSLQANGELADTDEHSTSQLTITCEGTYHCEIAQVDKTAVIDTQTHLPNQPIKKVDKTDEVFGTVKDIDILQVNNNHAANDTDQTSHIENKKGQIYHFDNGIELVPVANTTVKDFVNYYVRLTTGKHEVHVSFYPENNDAYVERFAIIHEFAQPADYRLQAYRQPLDKQSDSLLDNASPAPLCVNLLQDKRPIRKFCKMDSNSQQNEFVEVKL